MKRYLAVGLFFVSVQALSIECGPIVHIVRIEQMKNSVGEAQTTIMQHSGPLVALVKGLIDVASTDSAIREADKMQLQLDFLGQARTAGERLEGALQTALLVAQIRAVMLDRRDKERVNKFLSLSLRDAGRVAELSYRSTSDVLSKLSIPGVAIDVAKLRDESRVVVKEFEKCE